VLQNSNTTNYTVHKIDFQRNVLQQKLALFFVIEQLDISISK